MSLLSFIIVIQCCQCQWILSSPPNLPRGDSEMGIGSWNGSVFLIGGNKYKNQLIQYDIDDNIFVDHGQSELSDQIYAAGQVYTQLNNTVYLIDGDGDKFSIFNMKTITFTNNWYNIRIPINVGHHGCLASTTQYLFVVGGLFKDTVQVLDITTQKWMNNIPSMMQQRARASCIVDATTNALYAIGGFGNGIYLASIEYINIVHNITQEAWHYFDNLTEPAQTSRAVSWNNKIVVIGGYYVEETTEYYLDTMHILNTLNGTISVSSDKLLYKMYGTGAIIVNNTLYAFGGFTSARSLLNTWMTYKLPPTTSPTKEPSNTPTFNPITIQPTTTYLTTYSPVLNLTLKPTLSPFNSGEVVVTIINNTKWIDNDWVIKVKGGKCQDGYTDLANTSSIYYDVYCESCSDTEAGINGECSECAWSSKPNKFRTDCRFVAPWWFYVLGSILMLTCIVAIVCGVCDKLRNNQVYDCVELTEENIGDPSIYNMNNDAKQENANIITCGVSDNDELQHENYNDIEIAVGIHVVDTDNYEGKNRNNDHDKNDTIYIGR